MKRNLYSVCVSVPEGTELDDTDKLQEALMTASILPSTVRIEGNVLRGTPGHGGMYPAYIED
jgi:hypothetical protein